MDSQPAQFNRTAVTWSCYAILGLYTTGLAVFSAVMPLLREVLGLNYTVTALFISAVAVGIFTAGSVGARLVARYHRKRLFLLAACLEAAALMVLSATAQPAILFIGVLFIGLGGATTQVIVQILLPAAHPDRRATAFSEANVVASIGSAVGPAFVGLLEGAGLGWRVGPVVVSGLLLVWAALMSRVAIPGAKREAAQAHSEHTRLPRAFAFLMLAAYLVVAVEWCVAFWTPDFLHRMAGFTVEQASTLLSLYFGAIVVGRVVGTTLTRRFSDRAVLYGSLLTAMIGLPVYWLAPVPWMKLVGLFITGFGVANQFPMLLSFAIGSAGRAVNMASSRMTMMVGAGIFSAPLLMGSLADQVGIWNAMSVVAGVLVLCLLVLFSADRQIVSEARLVNP